LQKNTSAAVIVLFLSSSLGEIRVYCATRRDTKLCCTRNKGKKKASAAASGRKKQNHRQRDREQKIKRETPRARSTVFLLDVGENVFFHFTANFQLQRERERERELSGMMGEGSKREKRRKKETDFFQ
jgi:hypothetical protein